MVKRLALIISTLWATSQAAFAAGGGGAAPLGIAADTRKLDGMMAWWANLYTFRSC